MKVDKEKKRLEAIKLEYVPSPTKCACCGREYKGEKMWQVDRYSMKEYSQKWNYCQRCMHSAEEVLNEIDTDEYNFGIILVDDRETFSKKDYTRMNIARKRAFNSFRQKESDIDKN